MTAVLALSGIAFAGMAVAQTGTTMAPTATTYRATTATTMRPGATTATTAMTAKAGAAAAPKAQARTGARTDLEVTMAGAAFVLGGALLFFGQPLRRIRTQS